MSVAAAAAGAVVRAIVMMMLLTRYLSHDRFVDLGKKSRHLFL